MRILFICPDWAGLAKPIIEEMKNQGHQVSHLDHSDLSDFKYYSKTHKILSKVMDLFSKKKYKHLRTDEQITTTLKGFFIDRKRFDIILFTEPNLFLESHFLLFKKNSNKLILSLWDGLSRMPNNGKFLEKFDTVFSYDPDDCKKYGFIKSYNYINKMSKAVKPLSYEHDVFCIMSYSKARYNEVVHFLDRHLEIKCKIYIYIDHPRKRKYITHPRVTITESLLLGEDLERLIIQSKSILDIAQKDQTGLSFRAYESLGFKRKLLTTNLNIKNYDFFDAQNIAIVEKNTSIDTAFFESEYKDIALSILNKYTLESWVKNLITKS